MSSTSHSGNLDKLREQIRWAVERGAFQDRRGQVLLKVWGSGAANSHTIGLIVNYLRPLVRLHESGQLPPFKASRLHDGEIIIGRDRMKRAIRDGLDLAAEPYSTNWAVWPVAAKNMLDDLILLLQQRLNWLQGR